MPAANVPEAAPVATPKKVPLEKLPTVKPLNKLAPAVNVPPIEL